MRTLAIAMLSALAFARASFAVDGSSVPSAPAGLLVNGASNPLTTDRAATRFTWRSADTGRGTRQTAYQILVASNLKGLAAGQADWWNSGKVDSDRSASVAYGGKPLPAATRCWWKVRVWSQAGQATDYSAPNCFDTGLNQSEWTAKYIWDGTTNAFNFAYFRKTFVLTNKPALARVYVTAHNDYLLYCNGQLLGRGPARCDPYLYGQYNAYDVTKILTAGTNVFAAMGHWRDHWFNAGIDAQPAFLLEARLTYPDGSSSKLQTDESWKVLAHTAFIENTGTNFFRSPWNRAIEFDSRLEPAGWHTTGFDDSGWPSATVVDRSAYHLFAQMAPMEREQAELKPVSLTHTNDTWLVDFGRCINGWPKLTLHANHSGDKVRIAYFQMTGGRSPAGADEYICHGGTETWNADFGRHTSFQVLQITGYAGKLKASDVRGIWAYSDADVAGRFHCSSDLLNDIFEMCERSARQNIQQGMISVDANREQASWLADSWNIGNVLLYNHRNTTMIDKTVRDYAAEQLTNGCFSACSPGTRRSEYASPGQASRAIPEWAMYWPMLLWQQYLFSGDDTLLREMEPRLTRFLVWIKQYQNPTNKLLDPPGWRISDYAGGNLPNGGYNIATTSQYYENLRIASRLFSTLGQTNRSADYLRQAEEVKAGINANLLTNSPGGEYYLARTDANGMFPLASAWALRFDIEPAADKSKILDIIEKAGKPNIGGYGGDALYSGLLNAGAGDFVVRDLARYRGMLTSNQACWEGFQLVRGYQPNHAWTAYPGYLFQKYILGIQPSSGGFATFDVRPETGGLTFAEGAVPTVKGTITTRWEKSSNSDFSLSIHVPGNTQASIYIPKFSRHFQITESDNLLWPPKPQLHNPDALRVTEELTSIRLLVGAGDYRFRETSSSP